MALNSSPDYNEWMDIYKKLVYWELEMEKSDSPEMQEVLQSQKSEANTEFFKFISTPLFIMGETEKRRWPGDVT
mgnify:CR=1 FL=1